MPLTFTEETDGLVFPERGPEYQPSASDGGRYTRVIRVEGHEGENDELVPIAAANGFERGHAHPRIGGFVALSRPRVQRLGRLAHLLFVQYGPTQLFQGSVPDEEDPETGLRIPYSERRPVVGSVPVRFDRDGVALGYETQRLQTRTEVVVVGYHTNTLYQGLWEVIKNTLNDALVRLPPPLEFRDSEGPTSYAAGTLLAKTYTERGVGNGVIAVEFLFEEGFPGDFQSVGERENADGTVTPTPGEDIYPEVALPQTDLWDLTYWDPAP